jgi:isoamylase
MGRHLAQEPLDDLVLFRVRVAVGPVAAEVDEEEKEAKALVERYALGSACKVLAGTLVPLGATPLVGGVNFIVYSC